MSKFMSRAAVTVAGLAVIAGASIATAGTAAADQKTYFTLHDCMYAGNTLAQQGQLTGYNCVRNSLGHYTLYIW